MSWMICGDFRIGCGLAPPRRDGSSNMTSVAERGGPVESVAIQSFPARSFSCRVAAVVLLRLREKLLPLVRNGTVNQMT